MWFCFEVIKIILHNFSLSFMLGICKKLFPTIKYSYLIIQQGNEKYVFSLRKSSIKFHEYKASQLHFLSFYLLIFWSDYRLLNNFHSHGFLDQFFDIKVVLIFKINIYVISWILIWIDKIIKKQSFDLWYLLAILICSRLIHLSL